MNYNKLDFNLFVEISLSSFKLTQLEIPDAKSLPILQVCQQKKIEIYDSREEIIKFLSVKNYLKKGISHSAWEQQSYENLINTTMPSLNAMNSGLFNRFQQCVQVSQKSNRGETLGTTSTVLSDTLKLTWGDWNRKQEKKKKNTLEDELNDWQFRLNGQKFHGGNSPDKADFFMFACLEANWEKVRRKTFQVPVVWNWKTEMNKFADQTSTKP